MTHANGVGTLPFADCLCWRNESGTSGSKLWFHLYTRAVCKMSRADPLTNCEPWAFFQLLHIFIKMKTLVKPLGCKVSRWKEQLFIWKFFFMKNSQCPPLGHRIFSQLRWAMDTPPASRASPGFSQAKARICVGL